ncbi:hypothetical protein [uncultured Sphingomonas sp.]|uniref:hypothetical protein n=1 Tax=uncultured Sphingomonas sp. TaxID=158754 RepID=UPI0025DAF32D|nr:hypothetical protein [uncultured Sphingomonas sp.]
MHKAMTTMTALLLIGAAPVPHDDGVSAIGTASALTGQVTSFKDGCGTTPCPAAEPAITWTPRVGIIAAAPPEVMHVVLDLLKQGRPISETAIRARLVEKAPESDVVTSVVTERYPCKENGSSVPLDLLRLACAGEVSIAKISISGQPASIASGSLRRLDFTSDIQLWYSIGELRQDAARVGLPIVDVSPDFSAAWPGHMPLMTSEIQIVTGGSRLAVAFTGSRRHGPGLDQDVITVDIYQPIGR